MQLRSKTVTLVTNTDIYADGDVLAIPQAVTEFFPGRHGAVKLQSLMLLDKADLAIAAEIYFLSASGSLGAINAAFGPTDAVAATILGSVAIATGDYLDLVNSRLAVKRELEMMLACGPASTSIWVGAVTRGGTPTYAVDSLVLTLGYEVWDR